jgi:hypothetical protein
MQTVRHDDTPVGGNCQMQEQFSFASELCSKRSLRNHQLDSVCNILPRCDGRFGGRIARTGERTSASVDDAWLERISSLICSLTCMRCERSPGRPHESPRKEERKKEGQNCIAQACEAEHRGVRTVAGVSRQIGSR